MNALPVSLLYTRDDALLRHICGYLHERATVRQVVAQEELHRFLSQSRDTLVFVDLRSADSPALLVDLARNVPDAVVVALGAARSDPGLQAAAAGVYAIEPKDVERLRLQMLFDQAQSHLRLRQENRLLKESQRPPIAPAPPPRDSIAPSLYHFSGAFRRFDNPDMMLENIVEGVASCARVSRVAVFSMTTPGLYRFRAGIKCVGDIRALAFPDSHPFVCWLQVHAHSLSRGMLRHIDPVEDRLLLEKTLDAAGAEVILPLFGRERLIGWLALGRPASGVPFEQREIEDLTLLAEQLSVAIENSLLHESLALQKALAENLLQAIPAGIVATGADGTIRWFNRAAERLFNVDAAALIGQPANRLSSFLASLLERCRGGENPAGAVEWTEPLTRRPLSIHVRGLDQNGQCMGSLAVLHDLTEDRILSEKHNNLERATFWNELAAAIAHDVRNPLVAISTFAQLLPERYGDEEFRTQFRDLTMQEVARLNGMINQLDEYAHPPQLAFAPVAAGELMETARCILHGEQASAIDIHTETAPGLPLIRGDAKLLADAIVRLLRNAITAVGPLAHPRVSLRAYAGELGSGAPAVVIEVSDNGPGIPHEMRSKVFSPFCTTKARGVGLGLPVVRRTLIDHGGLVVLESHASGTVVRLTLPPWDATENLPR